MPVEKGQDAGCGNVLRLEITAHGARTVDHFRQRTAKLRQNVQAHMSGLSPSQRKVVAGFLDRLTRELEHLGRP